MKNSSKTSNGVKNLFLANPKFHPARETEVKSKINKGKGKSNPPAGGQNDQFLQFSNGVKLIIFGGKGGTGKTTCSCAAALYLSRKYPDKKILVVSTDPAPSIGDSYDIEVGNKITKISAKGGSASGGKDNLWAYEMKAEELMEDFRKKNQEAVKTLIDRGTYLDRDDIEEFLIKPLPGMDELMAIIKIAEFLKEGKPAPYRNEVSGAGYDLIILDTAPTGHTKVLLSLPKLMKRWLKVGDLMMAKHRFMMRTIRGRYVEDECDKFLEDTGRDIERVEELLKNQEATEFIPVTIPEPMSILETEGLVRDLEEMDISVKSIICNRLIVPGECSFCNSRAKEKEKYLKMIKEKFSAKGGSQPKADQPLAGATISGGKDYNLIKMPLFPTEIRGQESLTKYAQILFGEKKFEILLPKVLPRFPEILRGKMAEFLKKDFHPVRDYGDKEKIQRKQISNGVNFVICGGKGGVGKTSVSAATAIAFAKKYKDKKILITTTDPAHALSNIFDQDIPLDTEAVLIKEFDNLFALEIDTQKGLQDWKDEYKKDIKEIFKKFTGPGVDIAYDRQVLEELMELSPPGLEELMALGAIMDLIKENKYDIYVLDSAASGHLLRFLELPGLVRDWLKSIFKILRKYQGLKLEGIAQKMVDFSRDVRKIQETLFNSPKTEFIMITIAEEMGLRVTKELADSLEKLKVNYNYIIANFINPPSRCSFCLAKRKDQEKYLDIIKKQYPSKKLILVPLLAHDIRGINSLNEFSKIIYG